MFGRTGDLRHAVETCVPGHQHVVESQRGEQFLRLLVLDEHHVEGLQRLSPHPAVGTEEDRIAAENRRDDIGADLAAPQLPQQVEPVFVFDEDGNFGMRRIEEPPGIARRVERQVEDIVGTLVVLADFVTRRREEGQQDLVLGMSLAEMFDDGASLLELSERCHVYPDDTGRRVDGLPHTAEKVLAPFEPQPGFPVARRHETDGPYVKQQAEIIEPHQQSMVLKLFNIESFDLPPPPARNLLSGRAVFLVRQR